VGGGEELAPGSDGFLVLLEEAVVNLGEFVFEELVVCCAAV
jgi:hypothetical protein